MMKFKEIVTHVGNSRLVENVKDALNVQDILNTTWSLIKLLLIVVVPPALLGGLTHYVWPWVQANIGISGAGATLSQWIPEQVAAGISFLQDSRFASDLSKTFPGLAPFGSVVGQVVGRGLPFIPPVLYVGLIVNTFMPGLVRGKLQILEVNDVNRSYVTMGITFVAFVLAFNNPSAVSWLSLSTNPAWNAAIIAGILGLPLGAKQVILECFLPGLRTERNVELGQQPDDSASPAKDALQQLKKKVNEDNAELALREEFAQLQQQDAENQDKLNRLPPVPFQPSPAASPVGTPAAASGSPAPVVFSDFQARAQKRPSTPEEAPAPKRQSTRPALAQASTNKRAHNDEPSDSQTVSKKQKQKQ